MNKVDKKIIRITSALFIFVIFLIFTFFLTYRNTQLRPQQSQLNYDKKSFKSEEKPIPVIKDFQFATSSPTQLLFTSPDGKRTGFDPQIGKAIEEIPKSEYFFDGAIADATGQQPPPSPDSGVYWLHIDNAPETFTLEVIQKTNKSNNYAFAFYVVLDNFKSKHDLFDGEMLPGERHIYHFKYNPNLEFPFEHQLLKQ